MKILILWLVKVFKVKVPLTSNESKESRYLNFDGQVVKGDLHVCGTLTVLGNLRVSKGIMMYADGNIEFEKDGSKRSNTAK